MPNVTTLKRALLTFAKAQFVQGDDHNFEQNACDQRKLVKTSHQSLQSYRNLKLLLIIAYKHHTKIQPSNVNISVLEDLRGVPCRF